MEIPDDVVLPHGNTTGRIIGAFFEVYNELGYGFSEIVYRRALAIVLGVAGLEVADEVALHVHFRGALIGSFRADLIVNRVVLVEVKAAPTLESYAEAQVLNYLKAAGGGVGLLLNFGRQAVFKRLVMGDAAKSLPSLNR